MLYCIPYRGRLIASLFSKMRFAAIVYSYCNFHICISDRPAVFAKTVLLVLDKYFNIKLADIGITLGQQNFHYLFPGSAREKFYKIVSSGPSYGVWHLFQGYS